MVIGRRESQTVTNASACHDSATCANATTRDETHCTPTRLIETTTNHPVECCTETATLDETNNALTCGFLLTSKTAPTPRRGFKFSRDDFRKAPENRGSIERNRLLDKGFSESRPIPNGAVNQALAEPVSRRFGLRELRPQGSPEHFGITVTTGVVARRATRTQVRQIVDRSALGQCQHVIDRGAFDALAQPTQVAVMREDKRRHPVLDPRPVRTLRGRDRRLFRRRPPCCSLLREFSGHTRVVRPGRIVPKSCARPATDRHCRATSWSLAASRRHDTTSTTNRRHNRLYHARAPSRPLIVPDPAHVPRNDQTVRYTRHASMERGSVRNRIQCVGP